MGKIKHMKRNKPKKFIAIYNCNAWDKPTMEIIASDTVRHVFLQLQDKKIVTIEYYNESTGRIMSIDEYYEEAFIAYQRMIEIKEKLGCDEDYFKDGIKTREEVWREENDAIG